MAEDPTPTEPNRNIRVAFKTEIVDLIVPPEEASSDEEDEIEDAANDPNNIHQKDNGNQETARLDPEECDRVVMVRKKKEEDVEKDLLDDSPLLSTDDSSVDQTTINFSLGHEDHKLQQDKSIQIGEPDVDTESEEASLNMSKELCPLVSLELKTDCYW